MTGRLGAAEDPRFSNDVPDAGYRRLTYMLLDVYLVAVSPARVWRVLRQAVRLRRNGSSPSKKGTGFVQPLAAHEHWHIDIAHINIHGTFYYLCAVLDGGAPYPGNRTTARSLLHPGEVPRSIVKQFNPHLQESGFASDC